MNSTTAINKIKYVLIGNALNHKLIGENSVKANAKWAETAQKIFKEYCKNIENKYEKNNKIIAEDGIYYCTISASNIFYLSLIEGSYPERRVFQMIDEFKRDNIHLLVDEKGELNKPGKQTLKGIISQFDNNDIIADINGNINEIKIEMHNNVRKVMSNTEDLQELDNKANKIKDNANIFKKDAANLQRKTCWQNCKWTIILVLVVMALLLIIVVPLVVNSSGGSGSSDAGANTGSNNPPPKSAISPSQPASNNATRLMFLN